MTTPAEDGDRGELELPSEAMLALARRASELLVERLERLADEPAWRGASREELEPLLRTPAPEEGRPPVQAKVIASQTAFMSSTRLRGRYSLRFCILNHNTRWNDILDTLQAIERFGREEVGA